MSEDVKFHFAATRMLYLGTLLALVALPTGFIAANIIAATDPPGHPPAMILYTFIEPGWLRLPWWGSSSPSTFFGSMEEGNGFSGGPASGYR